MEILLMYIDYSTTDITHKIMFPIIMLSMFKAYYEDKNQFHKLLLNAFKMQNKIECCSHKKTCDSHIVVSVLPKLSSSYFTI